MIFGLFPQSRAAGQARQLLAVVSAASRNPALFHEAGAPDTLEGRFETLTVYAALAMVRLSGEQGAAPLAQRFADVLFSHIDAGLREDGVGDLAVPKRMRLLAGNFYGRLSAYADALASEAPQAALAAALRRNVPELSQARSERWAWELCALAKAQAAEPLASLFQEDGWLGPRDS